MLTRKYYGEEDILKLFNEQAEEDEVDAEEPEKVSPEDIDLDSMDTAEKLELVIDILKSISDVDGVDDMIDDIKDMIENDGEEDGD